MKLSDKVSPNKISEKEYIELIHFLIEHGKKDYDKEDSYTEEVYKTFLSFGKYLSEKLDSSFDSKANGTKNGIMDDTRPQKELGEIHRKISDYWWCMNRSEQFRNQAMHVYFKLYEKDNKEGYYCVGIEWIASKKEDNQIDSIMDNNFNSILDEYEEKKR